MLNFISENLPILEWRAGKKREKKRYLMYAPWKGIFIILFWNVIFLFAIYDESIPKWASSENTEREQKHQTLNVHNQSTRTKYTRLAQRQRPQSLAYIHTPRLCQWLKIFPSLCIQKKENRIARKRKRGKKAMEHKRDAKIQVEVDKWAGFFCRE